jgi:hypothetical protein
LCLTPFLTVGLLFAEDFTRGVIGYGASGGNALDMTTFGGFGEDIPNFLEQLVDVNSLNGSYKGQLLAGLKGKDMDAVSVYARLWGILTRDEDKCGDFLTGGGAGTVAALLMGRSVLAIDRDPAKVLKVCTLDWLIIFVFTGERGEEEGT